MEHKNNCVYRAFIIPTTVRNRWFRSQSNSGFETTVTVGLTKTILQRASPSEEKTNRTVKPWNVSVRAVTDPRHESLTGCQTMKDRYMKIYEHNPDPFVFQLFRVFLHLSDLHWEGPSDWPDVFSVEQVTDNQASERPIDQVYTPFVLFE